MTRHLALACSAILAAGATLPAQAPSDSAAVRQTALDYIEGWYAGDASRMERAVHSELVKRIVTRDAGGTSWLSQVGASSMVRATRAGAGTDLPPERRTIDVRILDLYGDVAAVRVLSTKLIDYMQLARWDGRWRIVNVLWDYRPEYRPAPKP